MAAHLIPGVFAVSIGLSLEALAQAVTDTGGGGLSPFNTLGVFSAVVAAFIFMLKRSDGRDKDRVDELTERLNDFKADLIKERAAHDVTRAQLVALLQEQIPEDP